MGRSVTPLTRVAMVVATVLTVAASFAVVPASADGQEITRTSKRLPVLEGAGTNGMFIWTQGRRAYQLKSMLGGRYQVASLDIDSLEPTGLVSEPVTLIFGSHGITMDEVNGLIYLPQGPPELEACALSGVRCLKGVIVMDARTLQVIKTIQLPPTQGPFIRLVAMSYSPPRNDADRGKLHLILQETAGTNTSVHWLAQWDPQRAADPATQNQDWIVRVEACTTSRQDEFGAVASSHSVFRSPNLIRNYIYLGCYGSGATAQVIKIPLDAAGSPGAPEVSPGPNGVAAIVADPPSERLFVKAQKEGVGESWWVYDGKRSAFIGVVGISPTVAVVDTSTGFDAATGRMYVLEPRSTRLGYPEDTGGLLYVDARRTPLPQAVKMPKFSALGNIPILVDPEAPGRPRRLFIRPGNPYRDAPPYYEVFEDTIPISSDALPDDYSALTQDIDEVQGQTEVNYTGSGRGYGFRALVLGGAEAVGRDPQGGDFSSVVRLFTGPCGPTDREAIFGYLGPGRLTDADTSAVAEPWSIDGISREDAAKPIGRCTGNNLDPDRLPDRLTRADCVSPDRLNSSSGDPVLSGFASQVECGSELKGWSKAKVGDLGTVSVTEAFSTFKIYRDPERGLVARTESYTRGIDIAGIVKIDSVRAVAESWANGRVQPKGHEEPKNCDMKRSAGTCFTRSMSGVSMPGYTCGPCGDEQAAVNAMNRALGIRGKVRLRDPDDILRRGSANGYLAAVQKPEHELFVDAVLHNDGLTTLPVLEFIRIVDGAAGRGRQIFQFAGVESAVTYAIQKITQFSDGGGFVDLPVDIPIFDGDMIDTFGSDGSEGGEVLGGIQRIVKGAGRFLKGLVILLASPREAALMAAVWVILVLPAYFAERRRLVDAIVAARQGGMA